jgi:Ni,Fe-hydrogenase I large subunit
MTRTLEELETLVRGRICGVCTDRTPGGSVGAIEDATGKSFDRANVAIPPNPAAGAWAISLS